MDGGLKRAIGFLKMQFGSLNIMVSLPDTAIAWGNTTIVDALRIGLELRRI
jgi:hypothetical protein